ncbi:MAG: hypothetical protein IT466_00815 [Moraxellaceae bacterium]|jgi:hypothetical protein|nr:hypothetical protein [Moraxellaceae bacterium]MBP8852139.1 hypothetical protein [Moraxellaceae bacterium]MBP9045652.1 hypothetical protein [Moraxellaceae bacterium]MBP9731305.1 hypothetical protein [Moraxellaceae bacterium]MCC6199298.1 hypothetical protein [Moraxellaceae bacterium]
MRTLYYLMEKMDSAKAVMTTLASIGIDSDSFRIVSRSRDGEHRDSPHDAAIKQKNDFLQLSERGALIGGLAGLLFTVWVAIAQPLGLVMSLSAFLFVSAALGSFGAWIGGMLSISRDHEALKHLEQGGANGQHLMVITPRDSATARRIKNAMQHQHPGVQLKTERHVGMGILPAKPKIRQH